jgi:hypothetical protein
MEWAPAYSPDGAHWWDGRQWVPVSTDLSGSRRWLVIIGWVLTILVLLFDSIAALIGMSRADGHDISGTSIVLCPFLALITPLVVFLVWWSDP